MNRKSGNGGQQSYDLPLFDIFVSLRKIAVKRDGDSAAALLEQTGKIRGNSKAIWRKYLFRTTNRAAVERDKLNALNDVPILRMKNEKSFREEFFSLLHLFKARATLVDYADLNRRYFRTTDTVIFADGKVQLDTLPKCWLGEIADKLPSIAFTDCDLLAADVSLAEIAPFLEIDENKLYYDLERLFGVKIQTGEDAGAVIKRERYARFNRLVDLLTKFEKRDDAAIRQYITNNADAPTIFEYVIGIAWYHVNERRGDVLDYMNLSLEADLLPRTHAAGGGADIVWKYAATSVYPAHALLLEVTLADDSNQRRMEMESVSRHLGEYVLANGDKNAYCVSMSTLLHRNVVSDFRNRRTYDYFSADYENAVEGLKILPLAAAELKVILERGLGYEKLYGLFEDAFHSDAPVPEWYRREIQKQLKATDGEKENIKENA